MGGASPWPTCGESELLAKLQTKWTHQLGQQVNIPNTCVGPALRTLTSACLPPSPRTLGNPSHSTITHYKTTMMKLRSQHKYRKNSLIWTGATTRRTHAVVAATVASVHKSVRLASMGGCGDAMAVRLQKMGLLASMPHHHPHWCCFVRLHHQFLSPVGPYYHYC